MDIPRTQSSLVAFNTALLWTVRVLLTLGQSGRVGVSRVLTLRPALNRLGIAGMEQVNLFSTREDFVIDAVRFLSDQHKSYASDPLESMSTRSRPLHELTEHNATLGTTCKR